MNLVKEAKSRKGDIRISEILSATLELLVDEGYSKISLAAVARRLGMSSGNLQYYFPTRDSLLRSALGMQFEDQKGLWDKSRAQAGDDPWTQLEHLIAEDIRLCRSKKRKALALEKWAYSTRDAQAQKIVKSWFEWILDRHAEIVAELRPDLPKNDVYGLAVMVTSMLNGIWPFFGPNRLRQPAFENLEYALNSSMRGLILGYVSADCDRKEKKQK